MYGEVNARRVAPRGGTGGGKKIPSPPSVLEANANGIPLCMTAGYMG